MKSIQLLRSWLIIPLLFVICSSTAQDVQEGVFYKISCHWQGQSNVLDVPAEATKPVLKTSTKGTPSQRWKFQSVGNGYYRIINKLHGDGKSLDIVNDGTNNKLQLAQTGQYTGQFWKITPLGNGYFRMTTAWLGDGKSLDILNDGKQNNKPRMADTGNYTGQFWMFSTSGGVEQTAQKAAPQKAELTKEEKMAQDVDKVLNDIGNALKKKKKN